ncbi:MAG: NAD(P)/FAD-dependent oxidoreductase, partial [Solirubrobacterales bacterium]|nr:NAD(P)/FAD-dependent oxidoreductase [Solirubrobacterales bacterium]
MSEAIVVGAGPNGLACAATLAGKGVAVTVIEAGETIGGGTRSAELTLPGLIHDECSAVHSASVGAPSMTSLGLERHGLEWAWPEVDLAHPLDDGGGGALLRSIADTVAGLGADGPAWMRTFGASSAHFDALAEDVMRPILHLPRHPLSLARFGLLSLPAATLLARRFDTEEGRALLGGVAAHSFSPLTQPLTSAAAMLLICSCHRYGWPVAKGGSQAIADALAAVILESGGKIETGRTVR